MAHDRRNCPWCGGVPVAMFEQGTWNLFCGNDKCNMKPFSVIDFKSKEEALHAWNNPTKKRERYYGESELRKIFSDELVDESVWNLFFPGVKLWDKGE